MPKTYDIVKVRSYIAEDTLKYGCKVLPTVCGSLGIDIECNSQNTTGIKKLAFKGSKGALYGCLYFNAGGIKASLCCQNKGVGYYVVDYRGVDNGIVIAHFAKYIPVESTLRKDFDEAVNRCHEFIDLLADLSPWSGWVHPESNWDRDDVKSEREMVELVKAFASSEPSYGVRTKKEFKERYEC